MVLCKEGALKDNLGDQTLVPPGFTKPSVTDIISHHYFVVLIPLHKLHAPSPCKQRRYRGFVCPWNPCVSCRVMSVSYLLTKRQRITIQVLNKIS